jgi:hypothetical protein
VHTFLSLFNGIQTGFEVDRKAYQFRLEPEDVSAAMRDGRRSARPRGRARPGTAIEALFAAAEMSRSSGLALRCRL